MRMTILALMLVGSVCGGCGSRTHITTLQLEPNNRGALHLAGGSPRITVNNRGPAPVKVRFVPASGAANAARIRRGGKVVRDIDAPGKVVIETGPDGKATVTCVIEGGSGLTIDRAKPR